MPLGPRTPLRRASYSSGLLDALRSSRFADSRWIPWLQIPAKVSSAFSDVGQSVRVAALRSGSGEDRWRRVGGVSRTSHPLEVNSRLSIPRSAVVGHQ